MRIVIDTNQLVILLARCEGQLRLKSYLTGDGITHITSAFIMGEVERVLRRKFGHTKRQALVAMRLLKRHSIVVRPQTIETIARDPYDDYILAAALIGGADYIVTADNDLLVLGQYRGICIVGAERIDEMLKGQEEGRA